MTVHLILPAAQLLVRIVENSQYNRSLKGSQNLERSLLRTVQAAITSIGFPESLEGVRDMVDKHEGWLTDLDALIEASAANGKRNWTAPKWMSEGDILFFYHTKNASRKITKLLEEVEPSTLSGRLRRRFGRERQMRSLLKRSAGLAAKYSGTILGCAEISGSAEYFRRESKEAPHFKSRIFAPIGNVHIFDPPLNADKFAVFLKIGQGAITPLHGEQFDKVKDLLLRHTKAPDFLRTARIGGPSFRDVNKDNWPLISCREDARFIDEAQIRAYLLDWLLTEIKDSGTPLLKECYVYRARQKGRSKISDYFVRIHGRWIPVEAKLNVLAERNVLGQVAEYVSLDHFVPSLGERKGEQFVANGSTLCVIADQSGLYIVKDGEFLDCSPGEPIWMRKELDHSTAQAIRDRIEKEIDNE